MKHINWMDFFDEMQPILASAVGSDYAHYIASDDAFFSSVIQNVEETSAWNDEGFYTDDDIRLAIGRAIMWKFNIEY